MQTRYLRQYMVLAVIRTVHIRMVSAVLMALCIAIDNNHYIAMDPPLGHRYIHQFSIVVSSFCFHELVPARPTEYNAVVVLPSISFQASSLIITVPPW